MIRLLHLTVGLEWGGAENLVAELCSRFDRRRFDVRVVSLKGDGPVGRKLRERGVPVACLGGSGRFDPRVPFRFLAEIRRSRPDVVHSHQLRGSLLAAAAKGPYKLVWHDHSLGDWMGPLLRAAERAALRRADALLVSSENVCRRTLARVPGAADRARVIPNGVDEKIFAPRPGGRAAALRSAWGARDGDPVVGFVGRVNDPVKGAGFLLKAAPLIRAAQPRARVVLIGRGDPAAFGPVDPSVVFAGSLAGDLADAYAALDLFVLPSLSEVSSIALLEAMASGRAAVATAVGGTPELLAEGETGRLVPPGDPAALAAAVSGLLADPSLRARFGAAARRRVEERFTLDRMVADLETFYESLAAPRP